MFVEGTGEKLVGRVGGVFLPPPLPRRGLMIEIYYQNFCQVLNVFNDIRKFFKLYLNPFTENFFTSQKFT